MGEHVDDRRGAAMPGGCLGGGRALHAGQIAQSVRQAGRVATRGDDLDRGQRAGPDAGVLERGQRGLGAASLAEGVRVAVGRTQGHRGRRARQQAEHDDRGRRRGQAVADDKTRPRGPGAAGAAVGAAVRPVEAGADGSQDDRQQRDRGRDADQRDQHPAVAEAAQERNRHHDEAEQAERHRGAAEHHGPPGGVHRGHDRRLTAQAPGTFLAPAHHDQQRVVDRDAEADQRNQVLHDD